MAVALLQGCGATPTTVSPSLPRPLSESLLQAELVDAQTPLNVGIRVFDVATRSDQPVFSALPQVQSVERRLVPYRLKKTLDASGHWGAVRVMPRDDLSAELNVSGTVLFSDGVQMIVSVLATDAAGRVWLSGRYEDVATPEDYARDPSIAVDPFQDLFNRIANDLSRVLVATTEVEYQRLLDVAALRYASELSPESFARYLETAEDGMSLSLVGLPAIDDPLFARVLRVRESEYLFADSIDAHYNGLFREVGPTYAWWQHYSYELIMGNRRLEGVDATRGATKGSWYAMERVYKTYKESKMNEDALRELTESFDKETAPTVTELAGKVIQLNGTLDFQVDEWRRLLREIYREETGN